MQKPLARFWMVVAAIWILAAIAGYLYSLQQDIPSRHTAAVLPAILIELSLYAAIGVAAIRERLHALSPWRAVALLAVSSVVPYSIYTVATGLFDPLSAPAIAILAGVAAAWYVALPKSRLTDLGFLALIAVALLAPVFPRLYPRPHPEIRLEFLGHLMWIRITVLAVLLFRQPQGIDFGFWPRKRDWRIGIVHYLLFLPAGFGVALLTGFLTFRPKDLAPGEAAGAILAVFFGMLWVVALSEEFWFRGLLQQWLGKWLASDTAGLVLTSIVFGLVHLPFRGFPNWRFAALAAVAGLFYGRAYQQARGIRAPMVTHALVVTTWRVFF